MDLAVYGTLCGRREERENFPVCTWGKKAENFLIMYLFVSYFWFCCHKLDNIPNLLQFYYLNTFSTSHRLHSSLAVTVKVVW